MFRETDPDDWRERLQALIVATVALVTVCTTYIVASAGGLLP